MSTASKGESLKRRRDLFLYEMPAKERYELCSVLDQDQNTWMVLAEQMKYTPTDIQVRKDHFLEISMIHHPDQRLYSTTSLMSSYFV